MQRRVALGALGALRRAAPRATLARPVLIVTDSMRHATAPKMRALRAYSTAQYTAADLDVSDYSKRVDTSLDALTSQLEELIETEDIDEIEQTRGQGGSLSDWDVEYAVRRTSDPDWRAEPAHGHFWHLCDQQAAAVAPDLALEPDEVG